VVGLGSLIPDTCSIFKTAIDRWQRVTDLEITQDTLQRLSAYCSEFLIHAADVEGLSQGIDEVREEVKRSNLMFLTDSNRILSQPWVNGHQLLVLMLVAVKISVTWRW